MISWMYMVISIFFVTGARFKCLGITKTAAPVSQVVCNTVDGFLYAQHRTEYAEAQEEHDITYTVRCRVYILEHRHYSIQATLNILVSG